MGIFWILMVHVLSVISIITRGYSIKFHYMIGYCANKIHDRYIPLIRYMPLVLMYYDNIGIFFDDDRILSNLMDKYVEFLSIYMYKLYVPSGITDHIVLEYEDDNSSYTKLFEEFDEMNVEIVFSKKSFDNVIFIRELANYGYKFKNTLSKGLQDMFEFHQL